MRDYVAAQPRTKTQYDIARELDVAPNTLSVYLSRNCVADKFIARRISLQCDIPLENLLFPPEQRTA